MRKHLVVYVALLVISIIGLSLLLSVGSRLESGVPAAAANAAEAPATGGITVALQQHAAEPLSLLLLQIVVIVIAARLTGALFARMGQPAVIGEMVAGILLGPSLLGWLSPGGLEFLFPAPSLAALKLFSQIGVILFMFLVGMDLDLRHLREKAHAAVMVSHASILLPMLLGVGLALFLYRAQAPAGVAFSS
ncbi:MAG TPA: cation:proton antiporter, partial [Thermoanaerobaculia bacterium]|nr:cation:proton antiporter [Thermoanaerobaculia bacterium]